MRIVIDAAAVELTVELNSSGTAAALWSALPLESEAQTWGAEVYFSVPLQSGPEDPQATVTSGTVGYLAARPGRVPLLRPAAGESREPRRCPRG
jgi:hypothetical protein